MLAAVSLHSLSVMLFSELIDMWQVLCGDEAILRRVFSQLLEVLTLSLPYQEKHKGSKIVRHRTETPHSVNLYACLFHSMIIWQLIVRQRRPLLFYAMLKKPVLFQKIFLPRYFQPCF